MWPQSSCNCQTSCSQSQLQWDFSFSRLLPSSLQSTTFNRNDGSSQSPAARIVRLRCHSADAVARRSLAGDTDQISALGAALDRLSSLTDRLRSDLGRAARTCFAFLNALHHRLTYHAEAALTAGVGQVFREAFASEFDRVRRRSVEPLLEAGYETVAYVEQTIKQFRFTATSENVARKVLYYMADAQLSGKLETAIQALGNVTKVYHSFRNVEPLSSTSPVTSETRFDLRLVPYKIMKSLEDPMKQNYAGLSENIAGLIDNLLALKATLKDVYESKPINETRLKLTTTAYVERISLIRHFTDLFQDEVISAVLANIDRRVESIVTVNSSLATTYAQIDDNMAAQQNTTECDQYIESYNILRSFVRNVMYYASADNEAQTSALIDKGTIDRTQLAAEFLESATRSLRNRSLALEQLWRTLRGSVRSSWTSLLTDDLLRDFYLSLYNDAADPTTFGESRLNELVYDGDTAITSTTNVSMNADLPVIDISTKLREVDREIAGYSRLTTDAGHALAEGLDAVVNAYVTLTSSHLDQLRLSCELSGYGHDLLRDNVVVVDLTALSEFARWRHEPHEQHISTLLSHVGGLLALFLGASIVTVVELFDIALCRHRACAGASRKEKPRDRKSPAENSSNHVTSLPVSSNHRSRAPALKSATLPAAILSNSKSSTSNCATVPRQKVVCMRQAETDI